MAEPKWLELEVERVVLDLELGERAAGRGSLKLPFLLCVEVLHGLHALVLGHRHLHVVVIGGLLHERHVMEVGGHAAAFSHFSTPAGAGISCMRCHQRPSIPSNIASGT